MRIRRCYRSIQVPLSMTPSHVTKDGDRLVRITLEKHQVGSLPARDGSEPVFDAKEPCILRGCGHQDVHGRHATADEELHLTEVAPASLRRGGRACESHHHAHPGLVGLAHERLHGLEPTHVHLRRGIIPRPPFEDGQGRRQERPLADHLLDHRSNKRGLEVELAPQLVPRLLASLIVGPAAAC